MVYPLTLHLEGKPVLVVGGGAVATRRVLPLIEAGAHVFVVSPELTPELAGLADAGALTWLPRAYRSEDVVGKWLVLSHSGRPEVENQVKLDADAHQIFCVKGGDKDGGSAWVPARADHGDLTFAVTAGGNPRAALAARDEIVRALELGPERGPGQEPALGPGRGVDAERSSGETRTGRHKSSQHEIWQGEAGVGEVALIGGGPGDPGLITARGRSLLLSADVVVVDRLAPRALLDELVGTEVIDVGKRPGNHYLGQEQINELLVEHARRGKKVARLKGGDPFVLGRGREEADYCAANGVEVEVVPGVTSAISVPASVGIPVTHRGVSRGFSVLTGHEKLSQVPTGRDHTLVLLMAVGKLAGHAQMLIDAGRDPQCPVAIIEDGFGPGQRLTSGTLSTIAEIAREREVCSPAVVVVGDVVLLAK